MIGFKKMGLQSGFKYVQFHEVENSRHKERHWKQSDVQMFSLEWYVLKRRNCGVGCEEERWVTKDYPSPFCTEKFAVIFRSGNMG